MVLHNITVVVVEPVAPAGFKVKHTITDPLSIAVDPITGKPVVGIHHRRLMSVKEIMRATGFGSNKATRERREKPELYIQPWGV